MEVLDCPDILEQKIMEFLHTYESSIHRFLTQESRERIVKVLKILLDDETYFPKGFTNFKIRGKGERGLIFHTNKSDVVLKIPVQWTDNSSIDSDTREGYHHEQFFFGLWSMYEYNKDTQFFRVPVYYKTTQHSAFQETGAILMEEVPGRSIYFFGLIQYLSETQSKKFHEIFPQGKEDYMNIKNDDELARLFGITDIVGTLTQYLAGKRHSLDYESLVTEVFGVELRDRIMTFLNQLRKLGFEHGDIHPGNILIVLNKITNEPEYVYLIDFGKSKLTSYTARGDINAGEAYWKKCSGLLP